MFNNIKIGIMQGRLSRKRKAPQSFPFKEWRDEFSRARMIGFDQIEWLIDEDSIRNNPILSAEGRKEILNLSSINKIIINSLCAHNLIDGALLDKGSRFVQAKNNFLKILESAKKANIEFVIIPLQDEMSIKSDASKTKLRELLCDVLKIDRGVTILLESDLPAKEVKAFIDSVDKKKIGVVYDIGNATAWGFDVMSELKILKSYIYEIHIKDKFKNNGLSTRLGKGDVSFNKISKILNSISWKGSVVLETPVFNQWEKEAMQNYLFANNFANSIIRTNEVLLNNKIGVMQGRLLPKYKGRYQAFPGAQWEDEFKIASEFGLDLIEFIFDFNDADSNPLLSEDGIKKIKNIIKESGVSVKTICADYFMEAPLHSIDNIVSEKSCRVLKKLIHSASILKITDIVMPCVDQSSLENREAERRFVNKIKKVIPALERENINLSLETDLPPKEFLDLLERMNSKKITINYDIGNSAAMGYNFYEELSVYGDRITDIHIKDRNLNGPSVPLGEGNADFKSFFNELKKIKYNGPFIMQAYRNDEGVEIFKKQLEWVMSYLRY